MAWRYKINIKPFLTEDESLEAIKAAYDGVTKELKKVPIPAPRSWKRYAEMAIKEEDFNIFNMALDALYNWADHERIWMGM